MLCPHLIMNDQLSVSSQVAFLGILKLCKLAFDFSHVFTHMAFFVGGRGGGLGRES